MSSIFNNDSKIKKTSKIIAAAFIFLFLVFICKNCFLSKFGFNNFSIEFWLKVTSQKQGEKYITISDGKQEFHLIAHLQDEIGNEKGIVLSHNNGEIFGGEDFLPEMNTYSYFVINYDNNIFKLYLNNIKVGEMEVSDSFDRKNIDVLKYYEESIFDYSYNNYCLSETDINDHFQNNKILIMDNINYNEDFKQDAHGKVSLPITRKKIKYVSMNEEYLTVDEKYMYFKENNTKEDIPVSLMCFYDDISKKIDFVIKADNYYTNKKRAIEKVKNMFSNYISESDIFPSSIDEVPIIYESLTEGIVFKNGRFLFRNIVKNNDLDVKIIIGDEEIYCSTQLLKEYCAYLITYFSGEAFWPEYVTGTEKIHFAVSKDLKTFKELNCEINCEKGTNRFRDPFLIRTNEGYVIVSTQAYSHSDIYISHTTNLQQFNTNLINISDYSYDIGLHGNLSWGPEIYYDGEVDEYVILYSDPEDDNSCIYATRTKDFKIFSFPYVFFNAGYKVIDPTISIIDGEVYLFYKDEREGSYRICYATTSHLSKQPTWVLCDDDFSFMTKNYCEGPTIVKRFEDNSYVMYADSYVIEKPYSTNLSINNNYLVGKLSPDNYISKLKGIRHFSIMPITKDEYDLFVNE